VLLSDVELGLGGADGLVEVIVIEGRVKDLVTVLDQVGRLHAAGDRVPAVEEEDFHGSEPRSGTACSGAYPSGTTLGAREPSPGRRSYFL
jgi:hypothetical protein